MQEYEMIRKSFALDEETNRELEVFARKEHRDFSSALRYLLRIGLLAVQNQELTVEEIKDIMDAKVDYEMGNIEKLDPAKF